MLLGGGWGGEAPPRPACQLLLLLLGVTLQPLQPGKPPSSMKPPGSKLKARGGGDQPARPGKRASSGPPRATTTGVSGELRRRRRRRPGLPRPVCSVG